MAVISIRSWYEAGPAGSFPGPPVTLIYKHLKPRHVQLNGGCGLIPTPSRPGNGGP